MDITQTLAARWYNRRLAIVLHPQEQRRDAEMARIALAEAAVERVPITVELRSGCKNPSPFVRKGNVGKANPQGRGRRFAPVSCGKPCGFTFPTLRVRYQMRMGWCSDGSTREPATNLTRSKIIPPSCMQIVCKEKEKSRAFSDTTLCFSRDLEAIRTLDRQLRRLLLYPTELRDQNFSAATKVHKIFVSRKNKSTPPHAGVLSHYSAYDYLGTHRIGKASVVLIPGP